MFRMPMLRFFVGLGLCSLGGAMLYIYYKNKDEDEDNIDMIDSVPNSTTANKQQQQQKKILLQLVVSNEIVPILIGRNGANLKIIEDKTGTVITFKEKDDNHHFCEIRGLKNSVMKAKEILMMEIQKSPTIKEEIFVPQSACGKIIGRCGESLQEICRKSLAKVSVDSGDRTQGSATRRVVITGNRQQVNTAKRLIEEKVQEDEEYRKAIEHVETKREPRRSPTNSISSNHSSMTSSVNSYLPSGEKLLQNDGASCSNGVGGGGEKPLEVYVSAIASPARFWLQLCGPQSRKLDDLVEQMTDYYEKPKNQALHKIADPYLGQIVAAIFKLDGKWYRAEIVGILPNNYEPRDVVLDLYFVDYGDSEYVSPHEVFELRTDFLTLRFQAIECFLANVRPPSGENDPWDPNATTRFEELTHVASWKKLVSRVVAYQERPNRRNQGRREGSPIPGVELFDTSGEFEINIAHTLIAEGFAVSHYENSAVSVASAGAGAVALAAPPEVNDVLRLGGGNFNGSLNNDLPSSSSSSQKQQQQQSHYENNEENYSSSPASSSTLLKYIKNSSNNNCDSNAADSLLNPTNSNDLEYKESLSSSQNNISNDEKMMKFLPNGKQNNSIKKQKNTNIDTEQFLERERIKENGSSSSSSMTAETASSSHSDEKNSRFDNNLLVQS